MSSGPRRRRPTRLAVLIATSAVAIPAAVAVAIGSSDERPATDVPGPAPARASGFTSEVMAKVGALRGPRDQGDTATVGPPSVSRSMRPPDIDADFARSNGMNVAAARQVAVSPKTYAVPGRGVVCVLESGGGGGCTPNEYVGLDFQVQTCGSLPRGMVAVSGLVTDDVVAVAIRLRSGKTVPVESVNNFMVARLTVRGNSEAPVAVQLRSDGGTSSIPVVSPRADDLDCAAR